MFFRPTYIVADLIEYVGTLINNVGLMIHGFSLRMFKALRVVSTELRLLSNYRMGILKCQTPVDLYRRVFFEFLFLCVLIFGIGYTFLRYLIQPSFSIGIQWTFAQPLHRFLGGESISIFWRKDLWHVSDPAILKSTGVDLDTMYTLQGLRRMMPNFKQKEEKETAL